MKYYLGIDLGGTNIVAGIVNEEFEIVAKASTPTSLPRTAREVVDDMIILSKKVVSRAGLTMDDMEWVGVGCPGSCDLDTGIITYSNNLEWYDVPLKNWLQAGLGKDVYLDNDANAAAYGESMAGAGKGAEMFAMITLCTGVGGGIVIGGKIYRGFNFAGAELGHTVIEVDGRPCTCGRKGCFEAYASATGLIKTTKEVMSDYPDSIMHEIASEYGKVNGRVAFDAKRKGDLGGVIAVDRYVKYLAEGVTNIINTFQPNVFCIGGGISNEKEYLLEPLKARVTRDVYTRNSINNTDIKIAELMGDAGLIGAALLGFSDAKK